MDQNLLISSLGAALGHAADLTKLFVETKADEKAREKVFAMQSALAGALGAIAEMQREVDASKREVDQAKQELMQLHNWEVERQRYALVALSPGSFVHAIKASAQGFEPAHYICTHCHQLKQKSILQNARDRDGWTVWRCQSCKAETFGNTRGPLAAAAAPG